MALDPLLMTPGPTQVEREVLLESAAGVLNHVSPEFDRIHRDTLERLRSLFNAGLIILFPGSGTAAMELALRSLVRKDSLYIVLRTGYFAGYLEEGVRLLGGRTKVYNAPLGEGFTRERIASILDENPDADGILLQHVDTSTGVINPLRDIAAAAKKRGVRVLVDAVASAGGVEINLDNWGVDVLFTGSQKALSTPPGLGIVAYSSSYLEELDERASSSLYFNLPRLLKEMESTRNYYITPAVTLVRALNMSLRLIEAEGLEARYRRHSVLSKAVQEALEALGLEIVARPEWRAPTVTASYLPDGVEWPRFYETARRMGVELAGGLGELKGRVFRIGHMGQASASDIIATIAVVERALASLGASVELGRGLAAAQRVLAGAGL